jgi:hypothetical protein
MEQKKAGTYFYMDDDDGKEESSTTTSGSITDKRAARRALKLSKAGVAAHLVPEKKGKEKKEGDEEDGKK